MAEGTRTPAGRHPLLVGAPGRAVAFDAHGDLPLARFLARVHGLAARLPAGRHAVNLCSDRVNFIIAFCAVALRGQTTLLPASRAPDVVRDVLARHPDSYALGDDAEALAFPGTWPLPAPLPEADGALQSIDDDALVAIGFTSGSTGAPAANPKTWGSFRTSTAQNLAALQDLWPAGATPHIVATVPPQHMYGMELSVLLPLLGGAAVHGARPLFPHDVAAALAQARGERLLVTTPVHLRALVASGIALPPLRGIVSATAPLARELAAAAERQFACEVRELFGSTETCVFARRRTAVDEAWTPLPGVRVEPRADDTLVHAAHLPRPVALADLMQVEGGGHFRVLGRQADLVEIAGKRASLGDLTRRLLAVPGVRDGVMLQQEGAEAGDVRRLAAIVVADAGLGDAQLLNALRSGMDAAFLPRRILRVPALPRAETGKLPREALLALLRGVQ